MVRASKAIRDLRSSSSVKENVDDKYDFDVDEFEIPPTRSLKVFSRGMPKRSNNCPEKHDSRENWDSDEVDMLSGLQDKTESITSMILDIEEHHLNSTITKSNVDLLPDALYYGFHKRMLKQENRMLETELAQGENEAERLHLLYEKLDMVTWLTTLRKITVITDKNDETEVLKKKEQTQQYIRSILEKFDAMKKRCNVLARNYKSGKIDPSREWPKLYKKLDRRLVLNYHSSSDEDEEEMNAEDIRQYRRRKRQKQCRGSLIIQLTMSSHAPLTKYAIVAEPLSTPYVIRVSKDERKKWNKKMESEPSKFKVRPQLPNQIAVPKRRISIPLNLESNCSETERNFEKPLRIISSSSISLMDERITTKSRQNDFNPKKRIITDLKTKIHSPAIRRKTKKAG